jgi:hypothetical protein
MTIGELKKLTEGMDDETPVTVQLLEMEDVLKFMKLAMNPSPDPNKKVAKMFAQSIACGRVLESDGQRILTLIVIMD